MKSLHPSIKTVRTGTHHNALDDAITQARHYSGENKTRTALKAAYAAVIAAAPSPK